MTQTTIMMTRIIIIVSQIAPQLRDLIFLVNHAPPRIMDMNPTPIDARLASGELVAIDRT